MSDKVVVSCVKTRAGDGEVLVQAAHSLEAGETHAMALVEGRNFTEAAQLQREVSACFRVASPIRLAEAQAHQRR